MIASNLYNLIMSIPLKIPLLFIITVVLTACSQSPSSSARHFSSYQETGKASYYADKYQGRQTASGESFNQNAKTAAHKKLPFGTWVKVINVRNGKSIVVRINDRGPFVRGRIIDLSKSAFSAIASTRLGVVDVVLEIIR